LENQSADSKFEIQNLSIEIKQSTMILSSPMILAMIKWYDMIWVKLGNIIPWF